MNYDSAKRNKPAISHLFWWFLFANGGGLTALVLPVHILVQGVLGPLGVVHVVDRNYDTWISVLGLSLIHI